MIQTRLQQDPETVVTEEQPTEEPDENLSAADAVLPVEISYYLPKFQELKIEAPEEYTDDRTAGRSTCGSDRSGNGR